MTTLTQPRIVGTGLIALDVVIGPDPETPVRSWAGGTCGNVLSILAYLGWDAYPVARMNGDVASERVRADMARWGVHLDWTTCAPTTHTPMIVQEIRRRRDGRSGHRFSWSCPNCGKWLPAFKAITVDAVERVKPALVDASVFFLDRLSRATLTLAAEASARGAVVVFEPSGKSTDKLMAEATALAHVVKYADHRLAGIRGVMASGAAVLLEVQTLGDQGLRYRHRLRRSCLPLDASQGYSCTAGCRHLWRWRLVHGWPDCQGRNGRAGRAAPCRCPRRSGGASLWSDACGVELRLRRRAGQHVHGFPTSIRESDHELAQRLARRHR